MRTDKKHTSDEQIVDNIDDNCSYLKGCECSMRLLGNLVDSVFCGEGEKGECSIDESTPLVQMTKVYVTQEEFRAHQRNIKELMKELLELFFTLGLESRPSDRSKMKSDNLWEQIDDMLAKYQEDHTI